MIRRIKRRTPRPVPPRRLPPPPPPPVVVTYTGAAAGPNFGNGAVPTITFVNHAKGSLGVDFDAMVLAFGKYISEHIMPIWGTPANLVTADALQPGSWGMVFTDNADVANALGYHDLTPDGLPLSHVFVETAKRAGEKPSVTAAHELAEMLVDPSICIAVQAPDGSFWAYESADPVQEDDYLIDGIPVSNFIFPSYFEAFRSGRPNEKYDYLGRLSAPFSLRPGGYMPIWRNGEWTQIFGSEEKKARWAQGPRQRFARRRRDVAVRLRSRVI